MYYKSHPKHHRLPTAANYLFTFFFSLAIFILLRITDDDDNEDDFNEDNRTQHNGQKNAPYNFCDEAIFGSYPICVVPFL